jgi:hypothetical protein
MKNGVKTNRPGRDAVPEEDDLKGYPLYPDDDDIYSKSKKEMNLNPDELSSLKASDAKKKAGTVIGKNIPNDISGSDLDVPGSELDDEEEKVGSEDEENNYYSLGGDDHDDLDEDLSE